MRAACRSRVAAVASRSKSRRSTLRLQSEKNSSTSSRASRRVCTLARRFPLRIPRPPLILLHLSLIRVLAFLKFIHPFLPFLLSFCSIQPRARARAQATRSVRVRSTSTACLKSCRTMASACASTAPTFATTPSPLTIRSSR